jgi:hypothetical protein
MEKYAGFAARPGNCAAMLVIDFADTTTYTGDGGNVCQISVFSDVIYIY